MEPLPGPIRVTHVVLGLATGGLETVVLNLVRHSTRDRFAHRVVCLREPGDLAPLVEAVGAPVEALRARGRVRTSVKLVRSLLRTRPHVLHTHNPLPHQLGAIARVALRLPVLVHTKHGRNFPHDPWAVRVGRWSSRASDVVVPVSQDAADVARGVERVPASKILVIPNGVDTARFRPPAAPRTAACAVTVARLDPVKDIPGLLEAVAIVRRRRPDFRLAVVGEGPDRPRIEEARRRLGLVEAVSLLGSRSDVPERLAEASVFLLGSVSEGISMTLLEAMAAGLPIVATDVGGNGEVVAHGETGVLVPPRDPSALADAVTGLLADPARLAAMGTAGRRRAEERFSVEAMVRRYERLYSELLSRARRPGRTMP
jgi:sugar transferase (PEP-CTERM/EpsH1 system associated)